MWIDEEREKFMDGANQIFMEGSNPVFNNDIYSFLETGLYKEFDFSEFETDYSWEFWKDRNITPTIIAEWEHLDCLTEIWLRGKKKVLSVGGGGTSKTIDIMDAEGSQLVVLNPSIWDLNLVQSQGDCSVIRVRAFAERMPFKDGYFDAIEIPATIDHIKDPIECLIESRRVLAGKGRIILTCGNSESWYRLVVTKLNIPFKDKHDHVHSHHFSPNKLCRMLEEQGFSVISERTTAYLKLPKFVERRISRRLSLKLHFWISNILLCKLLGSRKGGMIHIVAESTKPS